MIPGHPVIYLLPYILAVMLPLALGVIVRDRNRAAVGRIFAFMLLEQALWSAAVLMEILARNLEWKVFWDDAQFLTLGLAALITLSFALRYEGTWFKGGLRTFLLLMLFPLAAWAFAATDSLHGLHRVDVSIDPAIPFGELVYSFRLPMLLLLLPVYGIALVAVFRLGLLAKRLRGSRRMGALAACVGLALPLFGTAVTIAGIRINGRMDASSLWLMAGDALVTLGIFRWRMAGVLPYVRKKIVDNLRDPVIVIDREGIIVDHNDKIADVLGSSLHDLRGRDAREVFSAQAAETIGVPASLAGESEITVNVDGEDVDFSLRMFPVVRAENARVLVFRDITALKKAERALRALSAELERKVEERVLDLEVEVRRRRATEDHLTELNSEMEKTQTEIMFKLSEVVENRGLETASHVARVSEYCRILGRSAGFPPEAATLFANASAMHDIGKIAIPDSILLCPGSLTPAEVTIMQSHTTIGWTLLCKSDEHLVEMASRIALEHHERWDGSGYPDGKKGMEISLEARLVSVCDVFDSLSATRPYRSGWGLEEILKHFHAERGGMFDPALVDLFFAKLDELLAIAEHYPDDSDADYETLQAIPS